MIYYQIVFYDGISLFGHKANVKCEMGMCTVMSLQYTSKYASDPSPDAWSMLHVVCVWACEWQKSVVNFERVRHAEHIAVNLLLLPDCKHLLQLVVVASDHYRSHGSWLHHAQ